MPIALFDIDGTLTASNKVDSACRARAFRDVFGYAIQTNWADYKHVTDRGIASEAFRNKHERDPTEDELSRDRARCVQLLEREPMDDFKEIPGAGAFISQLRARQWRVVLCTGAWSDSARLKLARAGLPTDLPLASCDDNISRKAILERGIALAEGNANDIVVSFGDALWDVRAAELLQLPFIGIGEAAETLRRSGVAEVFSNYLDAEAVFAAIERLTASGATSETRTTSS